jgi:hypothetical protein
MGWSAERVLAGFDRALTLLGPVLDRDGVNPTVDDGYPSI